MQRLSLSQFRKAVREVVRKAEDGDPTILTHYRRDVAAIIPMSMFPETDNGKKNAASEVIRKRRDRAS